MEYELSIDFNFEDEFDEPNLILEDNECVDLLSLERHLQL